MNVHQLHDAPHAELAIALEQFERQFRYPLGINRWFRISHGADYPRFFRAMGRSTTFVVEQNGCVLGTIGAAIRKLISPDGIQRNVVYFGDLKIAANARGSRAILWLSEAVRAWVATAADCAYGVVMDGTPVLPERYTGRLGIPPFKDVGKVAIWRISTAVHEAFSKNGLSETNEEVGQECFGRLAHGHYTALGGNAAERSELKPIWLINGNQTACGRLEDTRKAKLLYMDDGSEMVSAHLSCFAFEELGAGVELLRRAIGLAGELNYPALFVAAPQGVAVALRARLADFEIVTAPATIFAVNIEPGASWNINTAEI